ncbi:glucose-1-phosphate cytidylyltransferase [Patescibacteria group bacterium]|nr:glucose-1-phosphate cytidylyltransferase [Candidatus Falkowbacteria bacterium]MBU3906143.1 glucose-1-phosphate cytidylyltransferase [Patescibacteria group bacterium]MBU4014670.1 glucose-1-phosphate cytidylyltransferase [Patescibacteria group bacterium]MBU4026636.1 glucose-1-phosphate cytidylyltransferase [Patescibacteria group bacterium]MBU4073535.1 glucose-1-phosphate cytidylyltransferase [Patescibacteria group bacterium]
MKVVILCGGLGTRLKEETEFRPKPMVYVGNKPILWHIMKIYAHYGFKDFVLALGYKGDMIKEYFQNYELMNNDVMLELGRPENRVVYQNHEEVGWKVTLADTGQLALKGSRLKQIEKYIDGDEFMMTYGDGVGNVDISALLEFHRDHGKMVTITGSIPKSQFGKLAILENDTANFTEKPKADSFINGGFFVFNKAIFNHLVDDDSCDLEYGVLEKLSREGQVKVFRHKDFWANMDNFRDMEYLNKLWDEGKAEWKIW